MARAGTPRLAFVAGKPFREVELRGERAGAAPTAGACRRLPGPCLAGHADEMVGELRVHPGHVVFGHVAADAPGRADRAGPAGMIARDRGLAGDVAAQAAPIVGGGLGLPWLMRLVACDAREPCVPVAPAAAARQAVGL